LASNQNIEKEILRRVADGDEGAFGELFKRYAKLLYSFLFRHTDNNQLADDLVQDIFTKIWLTRESLHEIDNFASYLFVLARNHALNIVKKRIADRKRELNWHEHLATREQDADDAPLLDLIDRAVEQLPEQQRNVWVMSRRQGKKYAEVADEMGISRETVKTYLRHANANISKYVLAHADLAILLLLLKIL
jgi:RNA polymerase sigma-70 factor (ECF subfamily)